MRKYRRVGILCLWAVVGVWCASAQPKVSTPKLTFSYQVNASALPVSQTVQVTVPTSLAGSPLTVAIVTEAGAPANDWLTVTPSTGYAPLAIAVNVNPTGMTPGGYTEKVTVTSSLAPSNPAIVTVTMSVSNPSSSLLVTSPTLSPTYTNPPPVLTFNYNTSGTGAAAAAAIAAITAELDVASSSGDTIPFTVTASTGGAAKGTSGTWLRVNGSTITSGVALVGALIPFTVTVDATAVESLLPGNYSGAITFVATNNANLTASVAVNLVVSAGPPSISAFYPTSIIASPAVDPVITIYGDNFFDASSVSLQQYTGTTTAAVLGTLVTLPLTALTKLSQQVLRVVVPASTFTTTGTWQIIVRNPVPPTNPSQQPAVCPYLSPLAAPATDCGLHFTINSATTSAISAVLNAASFSAAASQTGSHLDPVGSGNFAVAPREIISIFGQNFGPPAVTQVAPVIAGAAITKFPTTWIDPVVAPAVGATITVVFTIIYPSGGSTVTVNVPAPLIMVSANQINAIVPKEVALALTSGIPTPLATVTVNVSYTPGYISGSPAPPTANTGNFAVIPVNSDPGLFTFDGLGKGQSAVLNYLSTGALVVNSTKNSAAKGSIIEIYATGLGELTIAGTINGVIPPPTATGAIPVVGPVRVDIGGQPAVVTYAGTAPGMVAGLVQINALVPPTVTAGQAVAITTSVGDTVTSRTSQGQVSISVK